jgi:hypothetical protein
LREWQEVQELLCNPSSAWERNQLTAIITLFAAAAGTTALIRTNSMIDPGASSA